MVEYRPLKMRNTPTKNGVIVVSGGNGMFLDMDEEKLDYSEPWHIVRQKIIDFVKRYDKPVDIREEYINEVIDLMREDYRNYINSK